MQITLKFRVRGNIFAYFLNNYHGDIIFECVSQRSGENVERASREPRSFGLSAYIGPRGWFGMRLNVEAVDWAEVRSLAEASYGLAPPKSLRKETGG